MQRVGTKLPEQVEKAAGLREMADRARRFAGKLGHKDQGRLKLIAFAIELEVRAVELEQQSAAHHAV